MTQVVRTTKGKMVAIQTLPMPAEGWDRDKVKWAPGSVEVIDVKRPNRAFCKSQIARLRGMPFAPRGEEALPVINGLIDVLERASCSEEHAKATIDDLLESPPLDNSEQPRFPIGYDISQRAYRLRPVEKRPDPNCPKCYGTGHELREVRGVQCADPERCSCVAPREVVQR